MENAKGRRRKSLLVFLSGDGGSDMSMVSELLSAANKMTPFRAHGGLKVSFSINSGRDGGDNEKENSRFLLSGDGDLVASMAAMIIEKSK
ncbi:hypothetical protein Lal_00012654 [Lupinus albus]|nr:hypothetical protein Lal_00012654 [Lupinus albus]